MVVATSAQSVPVQHSNTPERLVLFLLQQVEGHWPDELLHDPCHLSLLGGLERRTKSRITTALRHSTSHGCAEEGARLTEPREQRWLEPKYFIKLLGVSSVCEHRQTI